jgi:ABC-2 type transport system ATP-binding protein
MSEALASWRAVTCRFDGVLALDEVTPHVRAGQVVGLLGPNDAGKSTRISLLFGLRRPDRASVEPSAATRASPPTGPRRCTRQESALPQTLRVREVLDVVAGHFRPLPAERVDVLAGGERAAHRAEAR